VPTPILAALGAMVRLRAGTARPTKAG
jgi:hypothetical protein